MRPTISRLLIACVTIALIPARPGAQEQTPAAARLSPANWSYIRGLPPGTEVDITVRDERLGRRVFVAADDSRLTVLNVTHPALSAAVKKILIELAVSHPETFGDDEISGTFVVGEVRVGPDGVFDARGRIIDIDLLVQTIDRDEIAMLDTGGLQYTHELRRRMPRGLLWTGVGLLSYAGVLLRLSVDDRGDGFLNGARVFAAGGATLLVIGAARSHSRMPSLRFGPRGFAIEESLWFR